jgi:hypothetical protein
MEDLLRPPNMSQSSCGWFDLLEKGVLPYLNQGKIEFVAPLKAVDVARDGDCLFSAFALSLASCVETGDSVNLAQRYRVYERYVSAGNQVASASQGAKMRSYFCSNYMSAFNRESGEAKYLAAQTAGTNWLRARPERVRSFRSTRSERLVSWSTLTYH